MYVYIFKNYYDEIIYVGKTKNIKNRMKQHFTDGHLPEECYEQVKHIFYADTGISQYDTEIIETLLIDQYKPIYNTEKKYNEKEERVNFKIPELTWNELFIQWNPEFKVYLAKPRLKVYNEKLPDLERATEIILYNIESLTYKAGLYEYYFEDELSKDFRDTIISIYKNAISCINYLESDIDEPITEDNSEISTYATIDIRKLNVQGNFYYLIIMMKYHFIFKLNDYLYAIPIHSEENLKIMNKYKKNRG